MIKDNLDNLFERLHGQFDIEHPNEGHELRFLQKLSGNTSASENRSKKQHWYWKPLLAVAATIIICFGLFTTLNSETEVMDLASVSPELSETQDFFSVTIENELKKLNAERSPLTEEIINDALKQIEQLETDYEILKLNLTESGNDKRVIYAMISNFQNRIDVLTNVLEQVENVKELKLNTDETIDTI